MEYKLNILCEFKNKNIENMFRVREAKKNMKVIRFIILFASIANFLCFLTDMTKKGIGPNLLFLDFAARLLILVAGIILFFLIKRIKRIKSIGIITCVFGLFIYVIHLVLGYFFAPIHNEFETSNLFILIPSIFLMPNRWIENIGFCLSCIMLYFFITPYVCTETEPIVRLLSLQYICWYAVIIFTIFYNYNKNKRNNMAKELELEEIANTDYLTNIPNRQACDGILEDFLHNNIGFSFIMFDIDNFKLINDTYGHIVGDEVLKNIPQNVKPIIRKDDILARWGGEEFVIILPGMSYNNAIELAKRVKDHLSTVKHNNVKQNITCSFGVTSFVESDDSTLLISRVDQLLYLAKEYGRNRIVAGLK